MSYFPYSYTGANQDKCEGVLLVGVADIVAVNCTSIHVLLKQKLNYALLSFEEIFTRINDDSFGVGGVRFVRTLSKFCRLFSAITSCFVQPHRKRGTPFD